MGCKWESSTPATAARPKLRNFPIRPFPDKACCWLVGVVSRGNAEKPDTGYPLHTH